MNIVVFGGNGFIGRYVVEKLHAKGHKVVSADNYSTGDTQFRMDGVHYVDMDITHREEFARIDITPDRIIHLAFPTALCDRSPQNQFLDVFTLGTINVLEYAKDTCNHLVYGSSISVYGISSDVLISEKSAIRPLLIYGCNKYANELYVDAYHQNHGLQYSILRISDTFGPYDRRKNAINNFIDAFLYNKKLTINGDGSQKRSFTYVEDMANAVVKSTEMINNGVYNIASSTPVSVNQLVQTMADFFGYKPEIMYNMANSDQRDYVFDCSLFLNAFGQFEETGFVKGLQNTIQFKKKA